MVYFIIIYGSYGITYSKGKGGSFHCPQCRAAQGYRHRRVRRFFHIFFVPLIPLTLAGEYVECGECKGTYQMEVLETDRKPAASPRMTEAQRGVRRILVMMMAADGRIEESEIQAIVQYLCRTENRGVTRDEVMAELEAARTTGDDLENYCRDLMGYLNRDGRRAVLAAAHQIASADGHVDPSEQRMLERLGIALGLKPAEVTSALGSSTALPAQPAVPVSMPLAQAAPPAVRAPFCPRCGAPGRWFDAQRVWGCDRCRDTIPSLPS